jgi:hypothetical protein
VLARGPVQSFACVIGGNCSGLAIFLIRKQKIAKKETGLLGDKPIILKLNA